MRERRLKKSRWPVNLENFQSEFFTFEYLIKKRDELGCAGALPEEEREMFFSIEDKYSLLADNAETTICRPNSFLADIVRQQAEGDLAVGIWRWWYNRRPIRVIVETEVIVGIYFHVYRNNNLRGKMLFIREELLGMNDKITPQIKNLLLKKFPFLSEIQLASQRKHAEWMRDICKKYGRTQELKLEWLREEGR